MACEPIFSAKKRKSQQKLSSSPHLPDDSCRVTRVRRNLFPHLEEEQEVEEVLLVINQGNLENSITMLYVFLVDTGTMLHLDMNLALESVENLKENIAKIFKVPADKQVLLISGGESLETTARVCSYSAGTDTNPIYLFSKSAIECASPPTPTSEYDGEVIESLTEEVESSLDLEPTYKTVVIRAQLAQNFYDQALMLIKDCERLVHEQHLQQQGWAAVVANLEDITQSFCARADRFEESYNAYLKSRQDSIELLKNFHEDLALLAKIPILPALLGHGKQNGGNNEQAHDGFSLLQWISSKDDSSSLEEMAAICQRGLNQLDCTMFDMVLKDVKVVVDSVNNPSMKEVKGLEDRLYGLDQLMHESKMIVREQGDQAQAFSQNQSRASNLGDLSILPDLCTSHRRQLLVMLKNHRQLQDIRRRCARAKEELASNLHARLRWVMYVERNMCDVDNKLVFYHESLKRLKCHMEIVQQIHQAPAIYLESVAEVVRRRYFTKMFLTSATILSHQATEVYDKEMEMRKAFMAKLSNHFLQSLFSGMNDYPPPFAAQTPPSFDMNLPPLGCKDIEMLRKILPNMETHLQFAVSSPTFFTPQMVETITSNSAFVSGATHMNLMLDVGTQVQLIETSGFEYNFTQTMSRMNDEGLSPDDPKSKSFRTRRDDEEETKEQPESEAETEEFEKVDKIIDPLERASDDDDGISEAKQRKLERASTAVVAKTSVVCVQDRAVATDDYADELVVVSSPALLEELKDEQNKLSRLVNTLQMLHKLTCEKMGNMKSGVVTLRQEVLDQKTEMLQQLEVLTKELQRALVDVSTKSTIEHEEVLNSMVAALQAEHTDLVHDLQNQLEMESGKLDEALQLGEDYRRQLNESNGQLETNVQQFAYDLEQLRIKLESERQEEVKRLSLEHELELDGTKEDLKLMMESKETEIRDLSEMRKDLVSQVQVWKCKFDKLEEQLRCQFQREKEEVLQALETSYFEREASAVSKAKEEGDKKIEAVTSRLKEEFEEQLKEQLIVKEKEVSQMMTEEQLRTSQFLAGTSEAEHAALIHNHVLELERLHVEGKCEMEEAVAQAKLDAAATAEAREKALLAEAAEHLRVKEVEHLQELEAVYRKLEEEKERSLREQEEKMQHITAANALREELEATVRQCREEQDKKVHEIREMLLQQHRSEMDSLRSRFRLCVSTTSLTTGSSFSAPVSPVGMSPTEEQPMQKSRRFQDSLELSVEKCPPPHSETWTNTLEELKEKHQEETLALMQSMKRTHQEQLSALRASIMGEKQASFNEAVNRVIREKDGIIDQLRNREKMLLVQLKEESCEVDKLRSEERFSSVDSDDVVCDGTMTSSDAAGGLTVSVVPVAEQERILELEQNLRIKQEEVTRLQHQLMELSMSSNTTLVPQDKVSVLSCNVGDIVLLCYDERHNNYLVFLVCPIYHFLHMDCLEVLGLQSGSAETRRAWTLAEVTDKEYCQAKKVHNRYRVPFGTKFYRVKAKPWDREPPLVLQGTTQASTSDGAISRTTTATPTEWSSRRSSSCPSPTTTTATTQQE